MRCVFVTQPFHIGLLMLYGRRCRRSVALWMDKAVSQVYISVETVSSNQFLKVDI